MASTPPPAWRQAYDAAERRVATPLESLLHSQNFAQATRLGARLQSGVRNRFNGLAARVWHFANLPAGTDILRLRAQLGALDREVRRLSLQLEHNRAEVTERRVDADSTEPHVGGRSRAQGDRA